MPASNSCGEPAWDYLATHDSRATDTPQTEIQKLSHELLRYRVAEQKVQLDQLAEKHFRDQNPAVKDAWEKYQTVLRLAQK